VKFIKTMSATDCGLTNTHQAGMFVPKDDALLRFMPRLDLAKENPEAKFVCIDPAGETWNFRYIYYNKRLFGTGTRNEYRITGTSKFIKKFEIRTNDELIFQLQAENLYRVEIAHQSNQPISNHVVLRGWRQIF